ncbi:MAG: NADH:flavin oxidoreductase/NADH oxidase, partial [Rhodospirillaceae bacterium]
SPMCQYHSDDGGPTDWQMVHIGRMAVGGAGIVFGEETAVEDIGRKTYACAGIWNDKHIAQYRRITDFVREQGAVPAIQLGHSGHKAACHTAVKDWTPLVPDDAADGLPPWQGMSPSGVNMEKRYMDPKVMDAGDIRRVLQAFREAVRRSLDAGYDIVEVHGAHGYLLHEFLSPVTNRRNDGYGGDRAGRMRFPLEVAEIVRDAWPADKPVFFRMSCVDGEGGLWNLDDAVELAKALKERDIDLVDCSSGGITGTSEMPLVPRVPGYQVAFSERIRREAEVPTMAVGLITDAHQAEEILQSGKADLAALARELLWNADWPAHAAWELGIADPHGVMPNEYAHRLRQRERAKTMPINQGGAETRAAMDRHLNPASNA